MTLTDHKPQEYIEKMNFSRISENNLSNLSAALGGGIEMTVEENTAAYAALANGGQYNPGYMIEKIVDLDGNVVFEHKVEPTQIYKPETAYIVSDMLKDTLDQGHTGAKAGSQLRFSREHVSAKTGTSQKFHDVWLMGYNPNITLSAWLGYGIPKPLNTMTNTYGEPSARVSALWAKLMNTVYATNPDLVSPNTKMAKPENVVAQSFCGISGRLLSSTCSAAGFGVTDLFNKAVFVPTKVDDSIVSSSAVTIGGQKYTPLKGTPSAFITNGGIALSPSFAQRMLGSLGGDPSKLVSYASYGGGAVRSMRDDGVAPAAPSAAVNGSTISWSASSSHDVVGYYIYRQGGGRIATVSESSRRSRTVNYGSYYVTAVDIAGRESRASNVVSYSAPPPPPKAKPSTNSGGTTNNSSGNSGSGSSSSNQGSNTPATPAEPPAEQPAAEPATPPAAEGESESGTP